MKIYDISQEVFSCEVYPGDTAPLLKPVFRTARGDLYNLSDIEMCVHNGTHIDSPFHFLNDGDTVESIPLEKTVGECYVTAFEGELSASDAKLILKKAKECGGEAYRRILLKGDAVVMPESASVFADEICLVGVESQSVGHMDHPMEVHKILLSRKVVLLEGIRLDKISEGVYFLNAAPISLGGCDGAPCRAILVEK